MLVTFLYRIYITNGPIVSVDAHTYALPILKFKLVVILTFMLLFMLMLVPMSMLVLVLMLMLRDGPLFFRRGGGGV